jgi:DNA-binding FadR family transcriptional regulator
MSQEAADESLADLDEAPGRLDVNPPVRQRVADHVFDSLAKAILIGQIAPGEPLPTQRELAKQFDISALVVRQAIHRLEDLGLVRVRQGSSTIVLDPRESTDIRLIQLHMELATPEPALFRAVLESQVLFLLPLLVLAERRITQEQVAVLNYIVGQVNENTPPEDARRFRIEYWTQIAEASGNPMYHQQIRWWSSMVNDLRKRGQDFEAFGARLVVDVYRRLNEALAKHEGAVQAYLTAVVPLLDWIEQGAPQGWLIHGGGPPTPRKKRGVEPTR